MNSRFHSMITSLIVAMLLLLGGAQDSAAQWKKVTNIPPPFNTGYYLDVFFLPTNPQYGWVCGYRGYVLRTTDGGQTWQGVRIPGNGNNSLAPMLESIHFTSPLIGYTSGPDGVFKSTNGGSSWVEITPFNPQGHQFWGCFFVTQDIGMVVSGGCNGDGQGFFRTVNGGASWTYFQGTVSGSGMSDVMLYSANGLGYASSSGLIWRTLDGGMTWSTFSSTGTQYWQEEITNLGSSFLVPTAGDNCSGDGRNNGSLRFSTDNGVSWRRFTTGESMFGTFLINARTGWGVGTNRAVYYTNDGGLTWDNRNCGIEGDDDLDDVYFINDTIGWTVGDGVYRTFYPDPLPLTITANGPLAFCEGDSVTLDGSQGFASYVWSNGDKSRSTRVGASGTYILTAFDKDLCIYSSDTVAIYVLPRPTAKISMSNSKPVICFGDTLVLSATPGYPRYQWSTGDSTQQIRVTVEGDYSVTITDSNGCIGNSDTIRVKAIPFIKPIITAKRNFTFCRGDSLIMTAPPGYSQYLWSNGSTEQSFTTRAGGPFTVTVVDSNGCVGVSDTVIAVELIAKNKLHIVVSNGVYEYDSTELGIRNCREVALFNRDSTLPYILDNPYLIRNVIFSVPQSQLPIVIPPLDTLYFTVCFAPFDTSLQRDTLIFEDTCSQQSLPLVAVGKSILANGISRCDVPLTGVIHSLGASYRLSAPFPQPSNSVATIILTMVEAASLHQSETPTAMLKDILGNTASIASHQIVSTLLQDNKRVTTIHLTFDTHTIGTGIYYVFVQLGGDLNVTPLIIQH